MQEIALRMRYRLPVTSGCVLLLLSAWALSACGGGDDAQTPPPAELPDAGADAPADVSESDEAAPDVVQDQRAEEAEPACVRRTCSQIDANCGSAPDGCGGVLSCGDCTSGQTCGADGPNRCGIGSCAPKSCVQLDASCGWASDGCSEAIDCGICPAPLSCGGTGIDNQCGCSPKSCSAMGASCGRAPDGCGGILSCGECPSGTACGGAGPYLCGTDQCAPKTCAQLDASCGIVSDGCSDVLDCGNCVGVDICGGTGIPNQCGCTPKTCVQIGASCDPANDHCGGEVDCGTCANGETCGGSGVPNQCGCQCQVPHAQTTCVQGQCEITKCDDGWADCDGQVDTGCETELDSNPDHCGSCPNACPAVQADGCLERVCETGSCQELPRTQGSPCEDQNACTLVDSCDDAGACVPGTPKACDSPPNAECWEATGTCDPATGSCTYAPLASGSACNADNDACTVGDSCDGSGTCVAGAAKSCTTPPNTQCYDAAGTCNTTSGSCFYAPKASGTTCNADSNACTVGDACNSSGTCVAGAAKVCNTPPNTLCYNTAGTCNTTTGACSYTTKANGTSCGTCKTCSGGTCGNAADGSSCGTVCQYCSGGSCATRPTGYQYDTTESHRCCSGSAVDISTNANHCGGCGMGCGSGTCQSVASPTACSSHPSATSGRCTCTSGTQCPKGRNGLNQTCRLLTPGSNLCAPIDANYCATGETYRDISSCPNYCYYP